MRCRNRRAIAPLVLFGCLLISAQVVTAQTALALPSEPTTDGKNPTGIITDQLSPKDLQRWNAIERLVFAQDVEGQYLHPTLRGLWEWIETSGHAIYIVFVKPNANITSTAGHFNILKFDPRGIGVIQLNLSNIDLAYVGRETWRSAGFIPFDQLSREDRYAEVLGHEMAHAVDILTSLERTTRVEEMVEKTNEMLLHHRSLKPTEQFTVELRHRLNHRDAMLKVLEATAEKLEARVWRELVDSKLIREKSANLVRK
jgi:hypothetical protein